MNPELRADCSQCFGLCCAAPAFSRSSDFAIDKPAGHPCPNLGETFRCGIHTQLRQRGFAGCTVYDCFGAGQHVAQVVYEGRDWRRDPASAPRMFEVFAAVRVLHELIWYLTEARSLPQSTPLREALDDALSATQALRDAPDDLTPADAERHRDRVAPLLREASALARTPAPDEDSPSQRTPGQSRAGRRNGAPGQDRDRTRHGRPDQGRDRTRRGEPDQDRDSTHGGRPGTPRSRGGGVPIAMSRNLIGAKLRSRDLRDTDLRGALLIGADLRGADLRNADVIGADLRGADLTGADLSTTLFLIQSQLDAASGDTSTKLPARLSHPAHWLRRDR
ncbi:pentapeptide repeat-containing protein [Dactylosporangium sp. CA-233914]|uniref:pentapeptide repeat-containing protein n=1 Tax=Dactylosporangium sp. CA-233914 TaxID=3239934 RepID=UPI003D8D68C6